jgi:hypothetical protein
MLVCSVNLKSQLPISPKRGHLRGLRLKKYQRTYKIRKRVLLVNLMSVARHVNRKLYANLLQSELFSGERPTGCDDWLAANQRQIGISIESAIQFFRNVPSHFRPIVY